MPKLVDLKPIPEVAQKVRTKIRVDRYPDFYVEQGEEGVITVATNNMIAVTLKSYKLEMNEWNGQLQWYDDDMKNFWEDMELIETQH
jgi:hypothetical protein